jgi:hypothetical protein
VILNTVVGSNLERHTCQADALILPPTYYLTHHAAFLGYFIPKSSISPSTLLNSSDFGIYFFFALPFSALFASASSDIELFSHNFGYCGPFSL